jgi:hypothetical protein
MLSLSAHSSGDDNASRESTPLIDTSNELQVTETVESVGDALELQNLLCSPTKLKERIETLAWEARFLCERYRAFYEAHQSVPGVARLKTRFDKEREMGETALEDLVEGSPNRPEDIPKSVINFLECNALLFIEIVLAALENEEGVVSVLEQWKPHRVQRSIVDRRLPSPCFEIDVVSCYGRRWIKVKATSARNMLIDLNGLSERRPYTTVVKNIVEGSRRYIVPFQQHPEVNIIFFHDPGPSIVSRFKEETGVARVALYEPWIASLSGTTDISKAESRLRLATVGWKESFLPRVPLLCKFINFDVTALVALASDTCNGYAGSHLPKHRILDEQAHEEATNRAVDHHILPCLRQWTRGSACDEVRCWLHPREVSVEPAELAPEDVSADVLHQLFPSTSLHSFLLEQGPRNWVVADVALGEFRWIIDTIAGPAERRRASIVLSKMLAVSTSCVLSRQREGPAHPQDGPSTFVAQLQETGKVALRHKAVFGLGDVLHAVTVTANRQFVVAAADQGVGLFVAYHPARALTESKRLGLKRNDGPRYPPPTELLQQ